MVMITAGVAATAAADDSQEPLRFRAFGDFLEFKVLVFGDLHYGESKAQDAASDAFQHHMLRLEAPVDLVVINGQPHTHTECRATLRRVRLVLREARSFDCLCRFLR